MLDILNIFPPSLILLTIILVIFPTFVAILLRHCLYHYLINSANKVSRLLTYQSRGKQPPIVDNLEARFKQASQKLEQVNTMALIDGLYAQEKLKFLGISLRCEQWDYFCQTLPNLLLAFGLLGTFIGISSNLYNLSQTINQSAVDVNDLVAQLQTPLQNMGIAFFTSLTAIACSSILIGVNLRCNTNFAKSLLISSLEDYLDNIFKVDVQGDTRLDKAVDRMVKQQQEFLERFHDKVGKVLETTMGNAAKQIVDANQGFQNNVHTLIHRFQDVSGSLANSTNSFAESVYSLKEQVQIVNKLVPTLETSVSKIESGSRLYLQGAEKIEASKFSENLENMTRDLACTQKSFSESTAFLGDQVHKISDSHQQATELAQQVYSQLQTASNKLQDSAVGFMDAAATFQESDFADKLTAATEELTTIPQQFNQSTAILHQSSDALSLAINNINTSTQETNSLIEQVNNLNQKSGDLLEKSDRNLEQEITELNRMVNILSQHKEQVNNSLANFGKKILTNFTEQTNHNLSELQNLTITNDRLLKSFEQKANNNTKNIFQLILEIKNLINAIAKHEQQMNVNVNNLNKNITNKAERQINNYSQQIQSLTEKINKIL